MEELLRLRQVCYDSGASHALVNYNLTLFRGEILFLMGLSGSGKTHVMDLIRGAAIPQSGRIELEERPVPPQELHEALRGRIRFVEGANQMVQRLSVLDNLAALTHQDSALRIYSRRSHFRAVEDALREAGIQASPYDPVSRLSFLDQQKLSVLKAYSSGAPLVVLNCVFQEYSRTDLTQLGAYLKKLAAKGLSILIVTEKPIDLYRVADRFQIIHRGMDVQEWTAGKNDGARLARYARGWPVRPVLDIGGGPLAPVIAITETDWAAGISARQILARICAYSPLIWREHVRLSIPAPGIYHQDGAVWIPRDSGRKLMENLGISDNLIACIPSRAGTLGIVHAKAQRFLLREFQTLLGLDASVTRLDQLDKAERKILSIYRWVLSRPHTVVLESPFWGMDIKDTERVCQYILHLSRVGIRILVITRNLTELGTLGDVRILSHRGRASVARAPESGGAPAAVQ